MPNTGDNTLTLSTAQSQEGDQAQPQEDAQAQPHGAQQEPPHGSAEDDGIDWKAEARKWEKLAKSNKDAAAELEQLKASTMSEQEKAAKRAEDAESALAAANRKLAIYDAAKETGVDASLLERMSGDTVEEIAENAKVLKESMVTSSKYPNVPDSGNQAAPSITADDIRAIKDPRERIQARAQNKDLFK